MTKMSNSFEFDSDNENQQTSAESKKAEELTRESELVKYADNSLKDKGDWKMKTSNSNPEKEGIQNVVLTTLYDQELEKAWEEAEKAERRKLEECFLLKRKSKRDKKNKVTIYLTDDERDYALFISYYYRKPLTELFEETIKEKTEAFLLKSHEVIACCNEEEALKRLAFAENSLHDSRECFIDDVNRDSRISEEQKRGIRRLFNTFEFPKISEVYNDSDSIVDKLIKVCYYYPKAIQQFYESNIEEFSKLKVEGFFKRYLKARIQMANYIKYLYYAVPAHNIKNSAGLYDEEVILLKKEGETWQV